MATPLMWVKKNLPMKYPSFGRFPTMSVARQQIYVVLVSLQLPQHQTWGLANGAAHTQPTTNTDHHGTKQGQSEP